MYINAYDGQLFVDIVNKDKTAPVFLLPGGPGFDHLVYKINQPYFEREFCVVYHDPRGCGNSTGFSKESMTLSENIEDIERIRAFFGFDKIMLLGTSYGSMVGLGYAIKYPQHVSKLALVAGTPSADFLPKAKENLAQFGNAHQIEMCNKFLWTGAFTNQKETDHFFDIMRSMYSNKVAANPDLVKNFSSLVKCQFIPLNEAFKNNFWNFNFVADLKKISCKTHILCGKNDWINDPMFAKVMRANIPNADITYFDSGHSIAFDCYDQYISVCSKFLNE